MGRSARPALTRERILETALLLVDQEGLESLSMRKLGAALSVEAMSLYNHVPNKAALLDGIHGLLLGSLDAESQGDWPQVLQDKVRAFRRVLAAHPRAISLFATRPAVTSTSLQHLEGGLEILRRAGLSPTDALSAFQILLAFVVGHALASFAPTADVEAARVDYAGLDPGKFPRILEAASALDQQDLEEEFELGLELLVRGINVRLRS